VLPDAKQLHKMIEKKLIAVDKMVDPPMNADPFLKAQGGGSIVPAAINYVPLGRGGPGFTPTMQIQPNVYEIGQEINRIVQDIRQGFYNDIFLATIDETKRMTATEVEQRKTEQMQQLGPIALQIQGDFLDPIIYRCLGIMEDAGVLPPMPEEISQSPMTVEYLGPLARAQAMSEIYGLQQFYMFISQAAATQANSGQAPDVLDKVDTDAMVDQMAEILDVSQSIVRDDREVEALREARAQAQQQQEMIGQAESMSKSAKNLSMAQVTEGGSMLDRVSANITERITGVRQ